MPRANRITLPGYVWHLTHRCHKRQFLLRYARDRRAWRGWLFEARKRFGLCVLDYTVTSNHVHLVVLDRGDDAIAASMQLIEGCTAQQFNRRKGREGAFWTDRYHATAIEADEHLFRCLVYVDLNMVRAGAVDHPSQWEVGGYHEIQSPRARYRVVDRAALAQLLGVDEERLAAVHREWIEEALRQKQLQRQEIWSEAVAVGSEDFTRRVHAELGDRGRHREIDRVDTAWILRDPRGEWFA